MLTGDVLREIGEELLLSLYQDPPFSELVDSVAVQSWKMLPKPRLGAFFFPLDEL